MAKELTRIVTWNEDVTHEMNEELVKRVGNIVCHYAVDLTHLVSANDIHPAFDVGDEDADPSVFERKYAQNRSIYYETENTIGDEDRVYLKRILELSRFNYPPVPEELSDEDTDHGFLMLEKDCFQDLLNHLNPSLEINKHRIVTLH